MKTVKVFVTGVGGQLGHDVMNELAGRGMEAAVIFWQLIRIRRRMRRWRRCPMCSLTSRMRQM